MPPFITKIKTYYQLTHTSLALITLSSSINLITLFLTNLISNIASYWSIDITDMPPVPDLFFESTIQHRSLTSIAELCMNIFLILTIFCILLRRDALKLYFRISICMSITYFLRMSIIIITNFPSPNVECEKIVSNFFTRFTYNRCGDLMFSGHTLIVSLCVLVWHSYDIFKGIVLRVISRLVAYVLGIFILINILVARNHYTVDVILGVYVTGFVWVIYGFVWEQFLCKEEYFKHLVVEDNVSECNVNDGNVDSKGSDSVQK